MSYKKTLPAANTLAVLDNLSGLTLQGFANTDKEKEAIKHLLMQREKQGLKKYGHTMDRDDLTLEQWREHCIEESLDGAQYAQRAGLPHLCRDFLKMAIILQNMSK